MNNYRTVKEIEETLLISTPLKVLTEFITWTTY